MNETLPLIVFAAALAACGPAPAVRAPVADDAPARVEAFVKAERQVLGDVSVVDGRLEARTNLRASEADLRKAATRLILEEDTQAAIVDGRVDVFSFGARDRALARAAGALPAAPLPDRAAGDVARPALERELVLRWLASEGARAKDEARLPSGATELVRGLVATWHAEPSEARDAWLAKRLGEVRASLASGPASRAELDELDDAIDPLEGLTGASYPRARAAIAELRVAIGAATPGRVAPWEVVAPALAREVGALDAKEIGARLEAAEKALRTDAIPGDATLAHVEALFVPKPRPCRLEGAGSIVRALGAPPERDLACALVRASAEDDGDTRALLHASVSAALWSLAQHGGPQTAAPLPRATLHGKLLIERRSASRPVDVIALGLAAAWLAPDPKARAARWRAFGDAPLDVVWRELGP